MIIIGAVLLAAAVAVTHIFSRNSEMEQTFDFCGAVYCSWFECNP